MSTKFASSNVSLTLLTRRIVIDNKGRIVRDVIINHITDEIYNTPQLKKEEGGRFVFR